MCITLGVPCHCQTATFSLLIFLSDLITAGNGARGGCESCNALMLRRTSEGLEQDDWFAKLSDACRDVNAAAAAVGGSVGRQDASRRDSLFPCRTCVGETVCELRRGVGKITATCSRSAHPADKFLGAKTHSSVNISALLQAVPLSPRVSFSQKEPHQNCILDVPRRNHGSL